MIASSAAWVQMYQHQIMDCLSRLNIIKRISWRPTVEILKEEGLDLSDLKKPDLIIPQTRVKVRSIFISICLPIRSLKPIQIFVGGNKKLRKAACYYQT